MKITAQKVLSNTHAVIYRLSNGRLMGKIVGLDVLLLTTIGRKSGQKRTLPLGYLPDGDTWVIIASNGGSSNHPGWYLNMMASHSAQVFVRGKNYKVRPEVLSDPERQIFWERAVSSYSGYANYAKKTTRKIPLVRLAKVHEI